MARRFAPLQRRRGLATLAAALGVEVDEVHRALPDARTCARVFCALFGRLAANAPTVGDALALLRPRKVRTRPAKVKRARGDRPHLADAPARAGRLHLPRRRRAAAVRRQVGRPAHARALALHRRRDLGRRGRARRPPGHGVRARGAAARGPADQGAAPARQRARQGGARRLRLPALPAGHPVPDPRGRARAGRRPRGLRRPGAGARGRRRAGRAAQLAVRPAPLRAHAAAARAPLGLRADGPLPLALPARPRPEPLPRAAGRGAERCSSAATAAGRCSSAWTSRPRRPRPSAATSARRGCSGGGPGWRRCSAASAACCGRRTRARGSCSRRTRRPRGASTRSGSRAAGSWTGAYPPAPPRTAAPPARGALGARLPAGAGARKPRRLAARRRDRGGAAGRRLDRRQPASCPGARGPDGGGGTRRLPRPGRSARLRLRRRQRERQRLGVPARCAAARRSGSSA